MNKIPKYAAFCEEDNCEYLGRGDTPDEAFDDFTLNGEFRDYCGQYGLKKGVDVVAIYIYSVIPIEDSEWADEDYPEHWEWCTDEKVETRTVVAQ